MTALRQYAVLATPTTNGWVLSSDHTTARYRAATRAAIPYAAKEFVAATTGYPLWQVRVTTTICEPDSNPTAVPA